MNCSNCNNRIFGYGCLLTNKKVTDHQLCDKWEPIINRSIHDNDARTQYFKAGMILDLGV